MQPLADTLRRSPVPPGEALALAAALAEALAAKVRDKTRPPRITPGTVMIEKRDDGSLAVEFKSGALPAPSGPVGADERAAVQELGVICYRLLTGKPPIKGNVGLIRDLEAAVASSPQPDALKALVLELISVDPARRPGLESAAERLVAISRDMPLPTSPAPLPPPPRAGGTTRPPPTPRAKPTQPPATTTSPGPAPPPITLQPIEPPSDLVPAAPVLPAEPVVVASTTRSKKKKNSTDTQERLFFAEGERLAAEERADAGISEGGEGQAGDDKTDMDVLPAVSARWRDRRVVIAAGAGAAVLLLVVLYVAFGGGDDDGGDQTTEDTMAAAAPATEPADPPVDTAKVAAAPEPAAAEPPPAAAAEPTPPAPEPPATEPEPPPAAEPEPPPAPAPKKPSAKSSKSSKSKSSSSAKPEPPPSKPKDPPKPAASSDPMAQAKAARSRGRHADAYKYYAQAAKKSPGAGTFGMAEMAYAMKKYGDAISLAKKAMSKGANQKACWKIVAKSHCARNEGRSAWFAFSKAGGGDCP